MMSQVADAAKTVFARIGSFFDLFDLSFFVSGFVALSAVTLWVHLVAGHWPFQVEGWLKVVGFIFASYVGGLLCFAFGRWIRIPTGLKTQAEYFDRLFLAVLEAHGLHTTIAVKDYIDRTNVRGIRRLYIRLWAEVRQHDHLAPSLLVLNRYWVMAATYDGLGTAAGLWAVLFFVWTCGIGITPSLSPKIGIPVLIFLLLCSFICLREAKRFVRNQVEELVATIALEREKT